MFSKTLSALVVALSVVFAAAQVHAAPAARVVALGNFTDPVYVAVAPGLRRLLFVVERAGRIQVLRDENKLAEPFLDIRDLVQATPDPGAGGEQGLLSVAFPPDYVQSRRFYVAFTNKNGAIEINEFRRLANNPLRAARSTRRVLLVIPHRGAQNHNGGQLQFGPDRLLYISTGDGGALTPPGEPARDLESLLGKILRISPLPVGGRRYGIPSNNPFVGKPGHDAVFAYGLRNPWRFSFDGGRIVIADVGAGKQEEVNFLAAADARGVNFGWPQYEGNLVNDNARPGKHPPKFPIFVYNHNGGRCAIIGGYVVRDATLTALKNRYLYGDLCTGQLHSFIPRVADQNIAGHRPADITLPGLTSFGEGFDGKIYTAQLNGRVSRLAPPP